MSEELKEELKEKEQETPIVEELKKQLKEQADQLAVLQQQLKQQKQEDEDKKKLQQKEALEQEVSVKEALNLVDSDQVETLTNKELLNLVAEAVEKSNEAKSNYYESLMEEKIEQLNKQVSTTQNAILGIATAIDIKEVKTKHSDFDKYQDDVSAIMQNTPGISVEDAYLLAKARVSSKTPLGKNVDREKPDSAITRSANDKLADVIERREKQKNSASQSYPKQGIVNFRDILNSSLDKVLAERGYVE